MYFSYNFCIGKLSLKTVILNSALCKVLHLTKTNNLNTQINENTPDFALRLFGIFVDGGIVILNISF